MNKLFAIISVLMLTMCVPVRASADTIDLGAGREGRGYDLWAHEMSAAYTQRGSTTTITNFAGSDEITLALCAGVVDIAPAQQDAAFQRAQEGCDLFELWTYPSQEYMFLMVPPKSKIDELADLTSASIVVTDAAGSGSDFTLRQLRRIELGDDGNKSDWSQLQIQNKTVRSALGLGASGKIQAVFFVGSLTSKDLAFYVENGWNPVEVYDKDIDDLLFNSRPLYEGTKVVVPLSDKVYTYRVETFIYGKELNTKEQETFESIMSTR